MECAGREPVVPWSCSPRSAERTILGRQESGLVGLAGTKGPHATPQRQASPLEHLGSWHPHHSAPCSLCSTLAICHGASGCVHGTTTPPRRQHVTSTLALGRTPCKCRPNKRTRAPPRPISLAWLPTLRTVTVRWGRRGGPPCSPPSPCGMLCVTPISSSHRYVDGLPQRNISQQGGSDLLPPSEEGLQASRSGRSDHTPRPHQLT